MSCKLLVIFAGLDKIDIVAKIASNMETCNLPLLIVFIYFEYMCTCSFKDHPIAWSFSAWLRMRSCFKSRLCDSLCRNPESRCEENRKHIPRYAIPPHERRLEAHKRWPWRQLHSKWGGKANGRTKWSRQHQRITQQFKWSACLTCEPIPSWFPWTPFPIVNPFFSFTGICYDLQIDSTTKKATKEIYTS